jgi:hypothetical protein
MTQQLTRLTLPALLAATVITACDRDAVAPGGAPDRPNFTTCVDKPQDCGGGGPGIRITGGGRIDPPAGKTTFGFTVDGRRGPPYKGQMQVVYHGGLGPMTRIHSETIDNVTTSPDPRGGVCATWGGIARVSDGHRHRYSATACDNGEPGSSPGTGPDRFGITLEEHGSTGVTDLTGGNIQAHK